MKRMDKYSYKIELTESDKIDILMALRYYISLNNTLESESMKEVYEKISGHEYQE